MTNIFIIIIAFLTISILLSSIIVWYAIWDFKKMLRNDQELKRLKKVSSEIFYEHLKVVKTI